MKTTLISSKDYGKTLKEVSDLEYRQKREAYDLLLDQEPKLGDFISCDKEGKPLENPEDNENLDVIEYTKRSKEYQEALERVKFDVFEFEQDDFVDGFCGYLMRGKDHSVAVLTQDNEVIFEIDEDVTAETLEDLTTLGLVLK